LRFSAVYRVGGSKSLPLFTPETGGGSRAKNRSFKLCGEVYRRVHWNNRGKKSIVWRCVSKLENTGLSCHSRTVPEEMLCQATVDGINRLLGQKDGLLTTLKENIKTVIIETNNSAIEEIDKQLEELQKDLLRLANSKEDYNDIADEIYRLREERHRILAEEAGRKGSKQRLEGPTIGKKTIYRV
jgi:site-specific DNA recombinase